MKFDFLLLFRVIGGTAVLIVAIIIAQMWFTVFADGIFWKLIVTLILLGGLAGFLLAVRQDISAEKKMRDDKYIS
jgi:D-alanyl-lipoteichoic acid acyltransferase DltB (MBOAT superfamily)